LTDLLRAEEAARHSRTSYWQAVYAYRTTYANLELAMGQLTAKSPVAQ
jgi:outer membrane protein TolC